MRIAVCGGVYSNPWAMRAFIDDARRRGAERLYCLGDLGGYGAEPEAIWDLLTSHDVTCIAGNYDVAIAEGADDCGCGYRDPRDQEYAQVMYDYTLSHTSTAFAGWMGTLPTQRRESIGGSDVHFVHGSPLGLNDFWWESLPEAEHGRRVAASGADVIMCTHSGLPWTRQTQGSLVINVGVLGRPANDGSTTVCYGLVDLAAGQDEARIVRLDYDWRAQAAALRQTALPREFAYTCETGWWTTCLEILPTAERSRGLFHVYDSSVPALLTAFGLPASAWPDTDPAVPVRSLRGSPLLPARIWHSSDLADLCSLARAVAAYGIELADIAAFREPHGTAGARPAILPELTVTNDGWFWHPLLLREPALVAARAGASPAALLAAAQQAATRRLLQELEGRGLLQPPRYCAA
jgi:predicted phosphodiesterase